MKRKILKFHYEELIYVLMILSTNLKYYSEEDLKCFSEAIHRLDTLSESEFLKELRLINPKIDDETILNVFDLHTTISKLYSGPLYNKLTEESSVLERSILLSKKILNKLDQEYIEPIKYAENNMDVNW